MSPSRKEAGLSHATLWLWLALLAFIAVPLNAGAQTSTAWDWGFNGYGQLGDNTLIDSNQPIAAQIPGPDGDYVTRVSGGGWHSLALTQYNGTTTVWAWGDGAFGQLGNYAFTGSSLPVTVNPSWVNLGVPTEIAAGGDHSLALIVSSTSSSVWAWGDDTFGQLGRDTLPSFTTALPAQVRETGNVVFPSNGTATAIAAGEWHSLALTTLNGTSTVWSWGNNAFGQLGNGTTTDRGYAASVPSLPTDVTAIAAGDRHSLALTAAGNVYAWGWNAYGQLGNNTTTPSYVPVQVTTLSNVVAIAAGAFHSLALDTSDVIWAWGSNEYGQLGNGTSTDSWLPTPVDVAELQGPLAIAAGGLHSLAVGTVGSPTSTAVWAWGQNEFGELGDDTNINRLRPVRVSHSGYQPIATNGIEAGWLHSLAIFKTGPAACATTTTTSLSATSTILGVAVTDTATVVNSGTCSTSPTGEVDFYYQCGTTTGPWILFSTRPLGVNGTSTSTGIAPPTAGTCYFYASYHSDSADHLDSQSDSVNVPADETLEIARLPTTVTTQLSATVVLRNTNVTDSFTISAAIPDPAATGNWYLDKSLDGWSWDPTPVLSGTVTGLPYSDTTPPFQLSPGFWFLRIRYGGDANHAGSASGSWSEILIVL